MSQRRVVFVHCVSLALGGCDDAWETHSSVNNARHLSAPLLRGRGGIRRRRPLGLFDLTFFDRSNAMTGVAEQTGGEPRQFVRFM